MQNVLSLIVNSTHTQSSSDAVSAEMPAACWLREAVGGISRQKTGSPIRFDKPWTLSITIVFKQKQSLLCCSIWLQLFSLWYLGFVKLFTLTISLTQPFLFYPFLVVWWFVFYFLFFSPLHIHTHTLEKEGKERVRGGGETNNRLPYDGHQHPANTINPQRKFGLKPRSSRLSIDKQGKKSSAFL